MRRVYLPLAVASIVLVVLGVTTRMEPGYVLLIVAAAFVAAAVAAAAFELYALPMLTDVGTFLTEHRRERRLIRSISVHPANKRSAA